MPEIIKAGDKGTTVHRKSNGAAYLHVVESYWDKNKKQARNKQVRLVRLDEETRDVVQSERKMYTVINS